MSSISIDNKQYDYESLPSEAKTQLANLQFVDSELARLKAKAAVLQTARVAYSRALTELLPVMGASDTLKL